VADRPELIELICHVVLHLHVRAGDIPRPAAAVRGAQGDLPGCNLILHLLCHDLGRLVERHAGKRNAVDEYILVEHAVALIERILDIDEPAAADRCACTQRDNQRRADHQRRRMADARTAARTLLLGQLARRLLRRSAFSGCVPPLCSLHTRSGGNLCAALVLRPCARRRRTVCAACLRAEHRGARRARLFCAADRSSACSALRRAADALLRYHPLRLAVLLGDNAPRRLRRRLPCGARGRGLCPLFSRRGSRGSSSAVIRSLIRQGRHLLLSIRKREHTPGNLIIGHRISYFIFPLYARVFYAFVI